MAEPAGSPRVKISIRGLVKTFWMNGNLVEVLTGVDLDIFTGETLAVVGASGVGKSTLLHILGTLERPTAGQVWWDGEDPFSRDDKLLAAFRNRKIGFVFQFHHLLPEFNALENVMMPGLIARLPKDEVRELAETVLMRVGLKNRLEHRVSTLSGGEQQRVAVARSLAKDPVLILGDEPTGNLDFATGKKVLKAMKDLNEAEGTTFIIVTHNAVVGKIAHRVLHLHDGRIAKEEINENPISPEEIAW